MAEKTSTAFLGFVSIPLLLRNFLLAFARMHKWLSRPGILHLHGVNVVSVIVALIKLT